MREVEKVDSIYGRYATGGELKGSSRPRCGAKYGVPSVMRSHGSMRRVRVGDVESGAIADDPFGLPGACRHRLARSTRLARLLDETLVRAVRDLAG